MIIRLKSKAERQKPQTAQHDWFAWYPVRVSGTEVVWLERVTRQRAGVGSPFTYKAID